MFYVSRKNKRRIQREEQLLGKHLTHKIYLIFLDGFVLAIRKLSRVHFCIYKQSGRIHFLIVTHS